MAMDRLSELPDCLLCYNILSRLSVRDAIRCSILSRRWKYLWTNIPHLDFSPDFFLSSIEHLCSRFDNTQAPDVECIIHRAITSATYIEDAIDKILSLHSGPLESLRFHISSPKYDAFFINVLISLKRAKMEEWIRWAALKGVKRLDLLIVYGIWNKIHVPPIFSCHLLTYLKLKSFIRLPEIPPDFEGFQFLKTCCLEGICNFTDERLEQLLALCPILEKLVLQKSPFLKNLKICSPNLQSLCLVELDYAHTFKADCPNLIELKVKNCYNFSKLQLNQCVFLSEVRSREGFATVNLLKKLSLKNDKTTRTTLVLFGSFPDLEELKIKYFIQNIAAGGKMVPGQGPAAGEVQLSLFPNLKKVFVRK